MAYSGPQMSLRLLVDKQNNRLVFAEADHDFVDTLFSFLTFPLGTIVRLIGNSDSNLDDNIRIGSLNNLYKSVQNLDAKYFSTEACKKMLLQPRNSSEDLCQKLRLNLDDTVTRYFVHKSPFCYTANTYKNLKCSCYRLTDTETNMWPLSCLNSRQTGEDVFVCGASRFMITDELKVMPCLPDSILTLLSDLGIKNMKRLEERTLCVSLKEILNLLKCSLISKTPLTDAFLRDQPLYTTQNESLNFLRVPAEEVNDASSEKVVLKVYRNKSTNKVVFAQAERNFVDLLLSFLTIPLGSVISLLGGESCLVGMDNLHKSVELLPIGTHLKSHDLMKKLVTPTVASQFVSASQILHIAEEPAPKFGAFHSSKNTLRFDPKNIYNHPISIENPKTIEDNDSIQGCFINTLTMYMVTDDLVVTPFSGLTMINYLSSLEILTTELEEQLVGINKNEALSILQASLHSSASLTTGLQQFSLKKSKLEKD